MRVIYTVEIAAKGSVKDDLEKTVGDLKEFGVERFTVGEELCVDGRCSAFVEVELDGDWGRHVEFAKRFAPTVIEPLEGVSLRGVDFFAPVVRMAVQSRVLLRGSGIRVPYEPFDGPRKLPRAEIERMILEEGKYRVNLVLSVALGDPTVILGAISRAGVVNDYLVKDGLLGIDFIGGLADLVMLVLYFMPVAVEPVEPVVYDLSAGEVGDVLMVVSERSREIISMLLKRKG